MPATRAKTSKKKSAKTFGAVPPYGPPIRDAIARGNIQEMRAMAKSTRAWLKDVQTALNQLDVRIAKLSSK
ncbi:MAG TPA: DUF1843 domain-containing protein [Pyrinomonadaceae bacterium]|nr:DUF1843 domain-containing protein [Pyrinomonadaceae bacterium]